MPDCQCEPLRWAELSIIQQAQFGNGCGPAGIPAWLTHWLFGWFFEASCRRHDFGYARGGSEHDRLIVDRGFYLAMLRDASRQVGYRKDGAIMLAKLFFKLVRWFGWLRFYYGPYRPLSYFFMR